MKSSTGWFLFIAFMAMLADESGIAIVFGVLALFSTLSESDG